MGVGDMSGRVVITMWSRLTQSVRRLSIRFYGVELLQPVCQRGVAF